MVIHLLEQSPSHAVRVTAPFTQGGLWCGATGETILDKSPASPVDCCLPPAGRRQLHSFALRAKPNFSADISPFIDIRSGNMLHYYIAQQRKEPDGYTMNFRLEGVSLSNIVFSRFPLTFLPYSTIILL